MTKLQRDQSWVFIGRPDVEAQALILRPWCEELTHLKRPWCWERLRAGREGDYRGWDGWVASLTRWTWVWVDSGSWWWTGRPGVLQFMGLQRVGHDWATELNWNYTIIQCQELILSGVIGSVKGSLTIHWLIKYCKIKAVQEKCMKAASETSQKYITSFTIGHANSV